MVWEVAGVWEVSKGAVTPEPGCGDGEEKAGSRETQVEASLLGDLADGREDNVRVSQFSGVRCRASHRDKVHERRTGLEGGHFEFGVSEGQRWATGLLAWSSKGGLGQRSGSHSQGEHQNTVMLEERGWSTVC